MAEQKRQKPTEPELAPPPAPTSDNRPITLILMTDDAQSPQPTQFSTDEFLAAMNEVFVTDFANLTQQAEIRNAIGRISNALKGFEAEAIRLAQMRFRFQTLADLAVNIPFQHIYHEATHMTMQKQMEACKAIEMARTSIIAAVLQAYTNLAHDNPHKTFLYDLFRTTDGLSWFLPAPAATV